MFDRLRSLLARLTPDTAGADDEWRPVGAAIVHEVVEEHPHACDVAFISGVVCLNVETGEHRLDNERHRQTRTIPHSRDEIESRTLYITDRVLWNTRERVSYPRSYIEEVQRTQRGELDAY